MEVSSTELFVEILLAGVLFTTGALPVLMLFFPNLFQENSLLPKVVVSENWPYLLAGLAFVYTIGIAGNRITEVTYKAVGIPNISCIDTPASDQKRIKQEIDIRQENKETAAWFERHKEYHKLLRAASLSSLLFMITVIVNWLYHCRYKNTQIYRARHLMVAGISFVFFTYALHQEECHVDSFLHLMRYFRGE